MEPLRRNLLLLISLSSFTIPGGCSRFNTFSGVHPIELTLSDSKQQVYLATLQYLYENDFREITFHESLGFIRGTYDFKGTETWDRAKSAMRPYTESMGLGINPYGKNPFVNLKLKIRETKDNHTNLILESHFQTWGEPVGYGGAGPFSLSSKGVWEKEFLNELSQYIRSTNIAISKEHLFPPPFGEEPAAPDSIATGTAFAVSPEGHLVTAYHIVQGRQSIKVYLSKESPSSAKVLHGDPVNDLAVLKIEETTPHFLQVASIRSAKSGDRVFTVGFPVTSILGEEAKYTEGVISSLSGIGGASSFLQTTVAVQPGSSGGPLVNESGEVVGIITSTAAILPFLLEGGTLPQNVNWAVKADYLRPMIELPNVERAHVGRDELIAHVKRSTFLIQANYHTPPKEELVPEQPTQSREPRVIAAPEPSAHTGQRPRLVVKGIVYSETNPSAMVGTEIVHEGDTISGAQVVTIRKDSVEFSFNGTSWQQGVSR